MSVIFFEGFEHEVNNDYWTFDSGVGYAGSGNGRAAGTATNACLMMPSLYDSAGTQSKARLTISAQTNKTLYIGFGVYNFRTQSNWGWDRDRATMVRFYDADDNEQFSLGIEPNPSVGSELLFSLLQGSTHVGNFHITTETGQLNLYNYDLTMQSWNYFEIEISNINGTGGGTTVSVRRNGMYLWPYTGLVINGGVTSVSKIDFYNCPYNQVFYDDLYIVDNAGSEANTWLGPETCIYSTGFPSEPDIAEWTSVGYSALNNNDNDSNYIKTSTFPSVNLYSLQNPYGNLSTFADKQIGGVSLWSTARKTSLDAAYVLAYKDRNASPVYELTPRIMVTAVNYDQKPMTFVLTNPATGVAWTPEDIFTNGLFGVKSVDPS